MPLLLQWLKYLVELYGSRRQAASDRLHALVAIVSFCLQRKAEDIFFNQDAKDAFHRSTDLGFDTTFIRDMDWGLVAEEYTRAATGIFGGGTVPLYASFILNAKKTCENLTMLSYVYPDYKTVTALLDYLAHNQGYNSFLRYHNSALHLEAAVRKRRKLSIKPPRSAPRPPRRRDPPPPVAALVDPQLFFDGAHLYPILRDFYSSPEGAFAARHHAMPDSPPFDTAASTNVLIAWRALFLHPDDAKLLRKFLTRTLFTPFNIFSTWKLRSFLANKFNRYLQENRVHVSHVTALPSPLRKLFCTLLMTSFFLLMLLMAL